MIKYIGIMSALLVQVGFAMEPAPQNLDELLLKIKELPNAHGVPKVMGAIKGQNLELFQKLCGEVMASDFYDKASASGVGTLKNRAMVTFCSGTTFERASLKQAAQKDKKAEMGAEQVQLKHREPESKVRHEPPVHAPIKVQLKHVELGAKGNSIEQEQANLQAVQAAIIENAEKLGKKQEYEEKLKLANQKLKEAQDFYDNLSAVIMSMRLDLDSAGVKSQLNVFKPAAHEHDSPEVYLEALQQELPKENIQKFNRSLQQTFPGFLEQIPIAAGLLQQANQHLAEARSDLERINREMLEFVEK